MKKKKNKKKKKTPSPPEDKHYIAWVNKWGKKEKTNKVPDYVPQEEKTDTKKDEGDTAGVVIGLIAIVFWGAVIVKCTTGSSPIKKATGFFEKRSDAKEYCAERADSASTSFAAKKIYKACMSNY